MDISSSLPIWESIYAAKTTELSQVRSPETYIDLFLAHAPEVNKEPLLSEKLIFLINQNHLQAPLLERIGVVFQGILNISEGKAHYHPEVYSDIVRSTSIPEGEKLQHACAFASLETIREIVAQSPELIPPSSWWQLPMTVAMLFSSF